MKSFSFLFLLIFLSGIAHAVTPGAQFPYNPNTSAALDNLTFGSGRTLDVSAGTITFANNQIPLAKVAGLAAAYQPLDADLTSIAALTTTSYGRSLLTQADASALRTTAGAAPLASPTFTGTVTTTNFVQPNFEGALVQINEGTFKVNSGDAQTSLSANSLYLTDGTNELNISASAVGPVSLTRLGYLSTLTSNVQTQLAAKVTGPASATDNALARFDLTTGKLLQNSSATLSDAGLLSTPEIYVPNNGFVNNLSTVSASVDDTLYFAGGSSIAGSPGSIYVNSPNVNLSDNLNVTGGQLFLSNITIGAGSFSTDSNAIVIGIDGTIGNGDTLSWFIDNSGFHYIARSGGGSGGIAIGTDNYGAAGSSAKVGIGTDGTLGNPDTSAWTINEFGEALFSGGLFTSVIKDGSSITAFDVSARDLYDTSGVVVGSWSAGLNSYQQFFTNGISNSGSYIGENGNALTNDALNEWSLYGQLYVSTNLEVGAGIGVWGHAIPVAQPAAIPNATGGSTVDTEARAQLAAINALLKSYGFTAP